MVSYSHIFSSTYFLIMPGLYSTKILRPLFTFPFFICSNRKQGKIVKLTKWFGQTVLFWKTQFGRILKERWN